MTAPDRETEPQSVDARRYPVMLDAATQLTLPEAQEFLNALRTALDPDNPCRIALTIHARVTQDELNRLTPQLPLPEVYCHPGSDCHGWTINLRAEDLLDCERANSAQIIA